MLAVNLEELPSNYGICLWIEDSEKNNTIEFGQPENKLGKVARVELGSDMIEVVKK